MIGLNILIYFLIIHFISDFILQTDYVAKNKANNSYLLFSHCIIYTIPFSTLAIFITLEQTYYFILITFLAHYVIDYISSRLSGYFYSKKDNHNFFVIIGLDQLMHYIQLFSTYILVKNF